MKIVVCVKQTVSGDLNPFDACAYEAALKISGAEVILISMGPEKSTDMLLNLTRLGAKRAILLTDRAFAGADTLATSYALSLAIKKENPDIVMCGRQTMDGDTAQVGPAIAQLCGYSLITNVMEIGEIDDEIKCITRIGEEKASLPVVLTLERINELRLPSIRSKLGEVIKLSASDLGADITRCGLTGSPTKVLKTYENEEGRRKCKFISANEFADAVNIGLSKAKERVAPVAKSEKRLSNVWVVGEKPLTMAQTISDDITVIELDTPENMAKSINEGNPSAVLWASDILSKRIAPQVAAILKTGLCADCTALETDGENLFMYRPAFSGNVIAKIGCVTAPAMATVRTTENDISDIIVAMGLGAKDDYDLIMQYVERVGGELAATRAMVDAGNLPYNMQVGLTGKTVNPPVYIAVGVSGAVHHIAGMKNSGTVIAINPDKNAPIFDYADFGILAKAEDVFKAK